MILDQLFDRAIPEPNSGCWLWLYATDQHGYGQIWTSSSTRWKAHRLAYILARGPIPNGLHVCHRCDVPSCINPDHLFLGTPADNTADKVRKGRVRGPGPYLGEKHGRAKLTVEMVAEIRMSSESQRILAARYGVAKSTIWQIVNYTTWRIPQ